MSTTQAARAGAAWPARSALSQLLDARHALEEPLAEFVRAAQGAAEVAGTDRAAGVAQSLGDAAGMLLQCGAHLESELENGGRSP